jgi:hypothetical protein
MQLAGGHSAGPEVRLSRLDAARMAAILLLFAALLLTLAMPAPPRTEAEFTAVGMGKISNTRGGYGPLLGMQVFTGMMDAANKTSQCPGVLLALEGKAESQLTMLQLKQKRVCGGPITDQMMGEFKFVSGCLTSADVQCLRDFNVRYCGSIADGAVACYRQYLNDKLARIANGTLNDTHD